MLKGDRPRSAIRGGKLTGILGYPRRLPFGDSPSFRTCVYSFGVIAGGLWGFLVGPISGFDLLNLRWMTGWVAISGADGISGSVAALLTGPWLHDGFVALLLGTGFWWIPPVVLGAIHGLLVGITFDCFRSLVPEIRSDIAFLGSLASLASPIVLTQVSRETGHVLSAVLIAGSLRLFLSRPNQERQVALLLAGAALVKPSVSLTVFVIASFLLAAMSGWRRIRFLTTLVSGTWFGAALLAGWVTFNSERRAKVEMLGLKLSIGLTILVSILLALAWLKVNKSAAAEPRKNLGVVGYKLVMLVIGASMLAIALVLRTREIADYRFKRLSPKEVLTQVLSAGNAELPVALSDWEIVYSDNSRIVALVLFCFLFFILMFHRTARETPRRALAVGLGITSSIFFTQISLGYVRYSSHAIALLPIAIAALLYAAGQAWRWRDLLAIALIGILFLPLVREYKWHSTPGLQGYTERTALLLGSETEVLSNLIPANSLVFLFGAETASAGPATGRQDVEWRLSPDRPERTGEKQATLFYDLRDTVDLDKFTTRGWRFDHCQALRFVNTSYGWCSMSVEQNHDE